MKYFSTKILISFLLVFMASCTSETNSQVPDNSPSQIQKPVKWSARAERVSETEAILYMTASLKKGWHINSQTVPDGPYPTTFKFIPGKEYSLSGKVEEEKGENKFDQGFGMKFKVFSGKAVFKQRIKTTSDKAFKVKASVDFIACDTVCIPPEEIDLTFPVDAFKGTTTISTQAPPLNTTEGAVASTPEPAAEIKPALIVEIPKEPNTGMSTWGIFFTGFLHGFLALLMPCLYPMIPLTVSFFTKQSKHKGIAFGRAFLYGVSIIVIYVSLGFGVTKLLGSADALNDMASNVYFNLAFFVLLTIFGISFLGAFEIQLPSSWVNKMDAKSDKGGIIGIFFMAFTLSLVSFSCTGPIIGKLLVDTVSSNNYMGPLAGMTGFAVAVALPFTLFALFPSLMNSLPKSGGWLNSVKVVFGFVELAFALKFLSNVDLAYHWQILDRDVFLALWIVIFTLLGFYLLGKIKFSHDSEVKHLSVTRFLLALSSFTFALYMVPGLWGAPLKAISAFTPPQSTRDFDLSKNINPASTDTTVKKNAHLFHCPHNLNCFFDYDEGMAYAKKVNKPVMLDFTGWSCSNCRKMEASVWSDPAVLKSLQQNYVLISLYVDDKTPLPAKEQYVSASTGKKVKTLGNKWSELQITRYNVNSQPYYILLDHQEKLLTQPRSYDLNIEKYIHFLDAGLKAFAKEAK